jgi:PAS domain S-box-containing protein
VEVRDHSPVLPIRRDYTEQAITGRGMALVAALTSDHGVRDVGPAGKTVWFTITGLTSDRAAEDLFEAWGDDDWDLGGVGDDLAVEPGTQVTAVRLLGLPPTLWLAARQHHDALLRELVLYLAEHDGLDVDVTAADRARAIVSSAVTAAVEHVAQTGTIRHESAEEPSDSSWDKPEALDLDLRVPADSGAAFGAMQDTLDAAEQLARAGALLVRPGLPEIIAVRDWVCEQIAAQLAGVAPVRWPGADQDRFAVTDPAAGGPVPDATIRLVRNSERGVVAADDANRIVAISRSLAEAVGWDVDDLVGRRIVTLVPPRLREAHVAGFTRHLSTGEAHVLGVPVTMPVLRADRTELLCRFLIERGPTTGGRAIFLAWIDPVPET